MAPNARAPYNFVPFAEKPVIRYSHIAQLPGHDRIDPNLLTGEICVKIKAETPIFVGAGRKKSGELEEFYRTPGGKLAIPGSTLRGLVRTNMQFLSMGLVEPQKDFEDYQIYFREMASKATGVKAAIKKVYTKDILNVRYGSRTSVPQNVQAGYLCKEGNNYVIYKVDQPLRISRKHKLVAPFLRSRDVRREPPHTEDVFYKSEGAKVITMRKAQGNPKGLKKGVLMFTGRPVGKVPNSAYVFPEFSKNGEKVLVSPEDILAYRLDFEARENILEGSQGKGYSKYWKLPEGKESKPVFYVSFHGHTFFGMSRFLRVGYPYKLSAGLPPEQRERWKNPNESPIDYPRGILGFADQNGNAYRSRVSFEDLPVEGEGKFLSPVNLVLLSPKPGYFPGYVEEGKPYITSDFRLRGYKQYWLKKEVLPSPQGKDSLASLIRLLDRGTEFKGIVRYKNLHPDELGLLLWALQLENHCYQSIGRGKPYGYGRSKVTLTLKEYEVFKLYESFQLPVKEGDVKHYIDLFNQYAYSVEDGKLIPRERELRECSPYTSFFYIHSYLAENTDRRFAYMSIDAGDYKNVEQALPTIEDIRTECLEKGG